MKSPLLTVIIPVYNCQEYLVDCVHSIQNAGYDNLQIIIVDDGSTDDSGKLADELALKDNRISSIHKKNGGQSSARNYALDLVRGDYITFVDADDSIQEGTYGYLMKILSLNQEIDILQYPAMIKVGTMDSKCLYNTSGQFEGKSELFVQWLNNHNISNYVWNKIFKKELFKTIRFREGMYYEDRYIMCDLLTTAKKLVTSDRGLYLYYDRPRQTTKILNDFSLQSKLIADMNIVRHIVHEKQLRDCYIERYNNCLYYLSKITHFTSIEINNEISHDIKYYSPSLFVLLLSHMPIGLKLNVLRHILGWRVRDRL